MIDIARALSSNRLMKALTGLSPTEFQHLLPSFEDCLQTANPSLHRQRQRAPGAGRKHTLAEASGKLFFSLFYLKCYPTFDLASFFFGVNRSQCHRWLHQLLPILEQALGRELVLPKRKISSVEEFVQLFPEVKDVLVDGTERPIQRPKNQDRQKANYSGKKKRHTKKNLVVSDGQKVLMLSATEAGKRHDYQMFKQSGLGDCLAGEGYLWVDLGFQGIGDDYPQLQVVIPHKKRRGEQLSKQHKRINRIIAQGRIFVEHVLSGIKRLRAVSEVYRHRREGIEDQFMLLACGLWNYHLKLAG